MEEDLEKKHKEVVAEVEQLLEKKRKKDFRPKLKKKKISIRQPNIRSNILGLIILISGVLVIINPTSLNYTSTLNKILTNPDALNIKIGLGLVIIGLFLIVLIYEKKSKNYSYSEKNSDSKKIKLLMSEKITLVFSIWIILLFFITYTSSLEVFFILLFIGTLVTKELTDESTNANLKKRINIFIVLFLIAFILIISQKIINIL